MIQRMPEDIRISNCRKGDPMRGTIEQGESLSVGLRLGRVFRYFGCLSWVYGKKMI